MYEPLVGRLPPSARFSIKHHANQKNGGHVLLFFTYQTVELFGVGTDYRSADLYHVRDHDLDAERIMLDLFEDRDKGHRRLTLLKPRRTQIHVTEFLRQFEVAFEEHRSYPVWATGSHLYVDLNEPLPS
jgi:hypothetical protein